MQIRASWSKTRTVTPDPVDIVLGYFTNEPPHGSAEAPVLIDLRQRRLGPNEAGEINLFLDRGLTVEAKAIIEQGRQAGYQLTPRDDRQMPAPKIHMRLRIAPGTEGDK